MHLCVYVQNVLAKHKGSKCCATLLQ